MDQTRIAVTLLLIACGHEVPSPTDAGSGTPVDAGIDISVLPYATSVVETSLGPGSGFGADQLPQIVLGPPQGHGPSRGSMDVLSLGHRGSIVVGFEPRTIIDGPGADFIVFENAFWPQGNAAAVFAELGRVAVSQDGVVWHEFTCETPEDEDPINCAGWSPTENFDGVQDLPLSLDVCGGDGFDLADLNLDFARYVRITDQSDSTQTPSAGFDLDAVGLIHHQ